MKNSTDPSQGGLGIKGDGEHLTEKKEKVEAYVTLPKRCTIQKNTQKEGGGGPE